MNKVVVLGVTGSIAAYKSPDIVSKLVKLKIDVHTIMTKSALKLITEQSFLTLSKNRVITDLWDIPDWKPEHISLADKADLFLVAPCTANFIGKYAGGIADDALTTFAFSHFKKVLLAPAMNNMMWMHPAVKNNCKVLHERGVKFIGPVTGNLACGTDGIGKMSDVDDIVREVVNLLDGVKGK